MAVDDPASVIAVGAVMPSLAIIAVALRFYSRRVIHNPLQTDDWILIPALLLTIGMGASLIAGVKLHALGYPTPFTGDPNDPLAALTQTNSGIRITSQVEWALQMMQVVQLGCIKLSFTFFYRRIFCSRTTTSFNLLTWATIGVVVAWTVSFFFALLLACKGYSGEWSAWWGSVIDLSTKCVKTEKLETGLVISDFLTDVFILLLPIPKIWALQMPLRRKLAVTAIFALGIVAVAASIVRMKYFIDVISKGFDPNDDEDLALTRNLYWSMVESGLGMLAVCLPTFRSLFNTNSSGWLTSVRSSLRSMLVSRSQPSKVSQDSSKKFSQGSSEDYIHIVDDGLSVGDSKHERYMMGDRVPRVKEKNSGRVAYDERGSEHV
ncbi:hypothetical protein LOCC1_G002206 [Lachnellula occidentalis]|uniref:Rhodopsin domain-containing protein n=1 Tax=Lachnellula occidentalis TaxID=215460 RepID=A0A8H8S696_9HELO|nr:hypothetical protein LOCC1_G002206 [Lachnellula occidentalis]